MLYDVPSACASGKEPRPLFFSKEKSNYFGGNAFRCRWRVRKRKRAASPFLLQYTKYVAGAASVKDKTNKMRLIGPDIAGHVINALYGAGVQLGWSGDPPGGNIVPLSYGCNTNYEVDFESKIKEAIDEQHFTVCGKIEFEYGDPEYPARPTRIVTAYMLQTDSGFWTPPKVASIDNNFNPVEK
jgi:hypothetical protein